MVALQGALKSAEYLVYKVAQKLSQTLHKQPTLFPVPAPCKIAVIGDSALNTRISLLSHHMHLEVNSHIAI